MPLNKKILWSGLGWVLGGPIGAIVGFSLANMADLAAEPNYYTINRDPRKRSKDYPRTRAGDFAISLLVLLAHVMKADEKMLKSELTYVKSFMTRHFRAENARDLMVVFKDILKQEYPLQAVCRQIMNEMDHAARLELVHGLFGLAHADGHLHPKEDKAIKRICGYIGVSPADFHSIRAMYVQETTGTYTILEVDPSATNDQVKRAYRKMAAKFHPDKVAHLGDEFGKLAEEKFKAVNDAYEKIKKERGIK